MTDLLPCPFCGGTPKLRTHRTGEDSEDAFVECPSCEVRTTYYEDAYAPTADAIAAWNRRAPSPTPQQTPIRWLVTNEVHGGSTGWVVVQHEHDARNRAARMEQAGAINVAVVPLYASPPPPDVRIVFGLEAQGHIPAVEAALAEGADWQEIGRRIGWDGETARTYYERHLARLATTEGKDNDLPSICDACTYGDVSGCQCHPSPQPRDATP